MFNTTIVKTDFSGVPKVLLQAKEEASVQIAEKKMSQSESWNNGPWDEGHWANRK